MYDAALQTQTSTKGIITKSIYTKIKSSDENGNLVGIHFKSLVQQSCNKNIMIFGQN